MDVQANTAGMTRRGLLTDRERELLTAEELDADEQGRQYQAVSRIRRKINERLADDVDILQEQHPELFEELQAVVCETDATNSSD